MPQLDLLSIFHVFFVYYFFFFFFYFFFIYFFLFPLSFNCKFFIRFQFDLIFKAVSFASRSAHNVKFYLCLIDFYFLLLSIHLVFSYCYFFASYVISLFLRSIFEIQMFFLFSYLKSSFFQV
jgi:hypothetical protein